MSRRYEIRSSIFDYAAFLARQGAAKALAAQGHKCPSCIHPIHAGHCTESNIVPLTPGCKVPFRCPCNVNGLRLTEETRVEVA